MVIEADIVTPWTEDVFGGMQPLVCMSGYTVIEATDITNQPNANIIPEPNVCVWRIVVDTDTFAAIEADSNFSVLASREVLT